MLVNLKNFDPVAFLNINVAALPPAEINQMRQHLNSKIGEYILLKISPDLTEQQLSEISQIKDGKMMVSVLGKLVPDLDTRVLNELENFKNDYSQIIQQDD